MLEEELGFGAEGWPASTAPLLNAMAEASPAVMIAAFAPTLNVLKPRILDPLCRRVEQNIAGRVGAVTALIARKTAFR